MLQHGTYPEGWTPLSETAAVAVYDCSPMLALILEAPAGDAVRLRFADFLGALEPISLLEAGWGFPRFLEACEALEMSPQDASQRLGISKDDEFMALQLGWFHPSLDRLVGIAEAFGWPLGALFRNGAELHPTTWLARSLAASRKPQAVSVTPAGSDNSGGGRKPIPGSKTNTDTRSGSRRRAKALQLVWGDTPIVERGGDVYQVPSQSGGGPHLCNYGRGTCDCKYWVATRSTCTHIEAVNLFLAKVRLDEDGGPNVGPLRHAFPQPWFYDRAKQREARCVRQLLRNLGGGSRDSAVDGQSISRGRPAASMGDLIVAGTHAAYLNKPGRKAVDDILAAEGLLACGRGTIAPITLRRYMGSPDFTVAIRAAIREVALCTRRLDTEFAIDSTYLKTLSLWSTCRIEERPDA